MTNKQYTGWTKFLQNVCLCGNLCNTQFMFKFHPTDSGYEYVGWLKAGFDGMHFVINDDDSATAWDFSTIS